MEYRKVSAIIPTLSLEKVEKALLESGVPAVCVCKVHGYDDYKNYFANDVMSDSSRVDVIVSKDRSREIVKVIATAAHQGMNSDGVIAVVPVEEFLRIRDFNEENYDE